MKQSTLNSILFFITLFALDACSHAQFIPLYPSEKDSKQTALLIVPIQIDLIYHNGEQKNITPPYKSLVNYRLQAGEQQLGFRYKNLQTDEDGNQEIITSKPVLIRFTAEAGKVYVINFKKPQSFAAAKNIEKNFQLTLTQNEQIIATSTPAIENIKNDSFFSSKPFSPGISETLDENEANLTTKNKPPQNNDSAIEHLKYWWTNASTKEKDSFTAWQKNN